MGNSASSAAAAQQSQISAQMTHADTASTAAAAAADDHGSAGNAPRPAVYNVYAQNIAEIDAEKAKVEQENAVLTTEERGFFPGMRRVLWGNKQGNQQGRAASDKNAVNPTNNMPANLNHGTETMSTSRVVSSIPKGGTQQDKWVYPSPAMFYNALVRKDKAQDVEPEDMVDVVSVHNSMNEATWQSVLVWESLHRNTCGDDPRLSRFRGRPDDYSFQARVRQLLGDGELPFDRHDWYVDRCGQEVRYIIDFYFHEQLAGTEKQFEINARPALDPNGTLPDALIDRAKMSIYKTFAAYGLPCPISGSPGEIGHAANSPNGTTADAASMLAAGCPVVGAQKTDVRSSNPNQAPCPVK